MNDLIAERIATALERIADQVDSASDDVSGLLNTMKDEVAKNQDEKPLTFDISMYPEIDGEDAP